MKAIIVDLDGTLANCEHRRHYLNPGVFFPTIGYKKDWKSFFDSMVEDSINEWCRHIIQSVDYPVIIVTGRPCDYVQQTEDWLKNHDISYHLLCMRPTGDFRADDVVKEEILNQLILPKYEVLFAIDDRRQVVEMWRRNGIVCLQCDEGDF